MSGVAVRVLADEVLARLKGMEERGGNLTGVNRFFGDYMKGSIDKNFDAEGRPTPWQPLSQATLLGWAGSKKSFFTRKGSWSKKGQEGMAGRKILTDSARLRRSITKTVSVNSIILGTNVIYAAIQQFGGQAGRGHKVTLPARPYMLFQTEDLDYYVRLVSNFVITGVIG